MNFIIISNLGSGIKRIGLKSILNRTISSQTLQSPDSGYHQVPQYKHKSALFIRQNIAGQKDEFMAFPKIISPDLDDMNDLFGNEKNIKQQLLEMNLNARQIPLSLTRLKEDYAKMTKLQDEIDSLNIEKDKISKKINDLVKSKKSGDKSELLKAKQLLIKEGNDIKNKINKIMESFVPIEEIVNIACLRLPNYLHASCFYLHNLQTNKNLNRNEQEEYDETNYNKHLLFNLNHESLKLTKSKVNLISGSSEWKSVLNNSIIIDSTKQILKDSSRKWSFIEDTSIDTAINSRYMTGVYAKLEQALVDYLYDRVNNLKSCNPRQETTFEHVRSLSMFKSAIVEGCGDNFNDSRKVFNVVRFHHDNIELLHLTGSSSLNALLLNHIRTKTKPKNLPWTLYTNGRLYSPKFGQANVFSFVTLCKERSSHLLDDQYDLLNSQMESKIIYSGQQYLNSITKQVDNFLKENCPLTDIVNVGHEKNIDEMLIDILKFFIYVYKDFNLPMRYICVNANELRNKESFRVEVQAYLPSEQNYVTVSKLTNFTFLNNFIIIENRNQIM